MFYRAFQDAHVQYEPPAYSVSLNLLVHPGEEDLGDQYYFDVRNQTIVAPGGLGNDRRNRVTRRKLFHKDVVSGFGRTARGPPEGGHYV
jgi:hypothetical protein